MSFWVVKTGFVTKLSRLDNSLPKNTIQAVMR